MKPELLSLIHEASPVTVEDNHEECCYCLDREKDFRTIQGPRLKLEKANVEFPVVNLVLSVFSKIVSVVALSKQATLS